MPTRRNFVIRTAAAAGAVTVLPSLGFAASQGASLSFADGSIVIHPVSHASFVMETPSGVAYVDPAGDAAQYDGLPKPDLFLITHRHGDHYDADLLAALPEAPILTNADVEGMMPDTMKARAEIIAPGETKAMMGVEIEAIPAYNITEGRMDFHPKARGDLGLVLNIDGSRVYVSGDTEGTAEMRSLKNIDLALVCMNLPFTMAADAAASAVNEFSPSYVYPYHYRGRDGGTQDPEAFAAMLGEGIEAKMGGWYG